MRSLKTITSRIAKLSSCILLLLFVNNITAQKLTTIKGKVFDAKTKEPLAFVDVILKGTYVGVSTDLDGQYLIQTKNPSDTIQVAYLGYKTLELPIKKETKQKMDFFLEEEGYKLDNVTILGKKGKYRKKNNPAVDLMRNVIANRDKNRIESQDYYEFDKHEKLELDFNNITEEFKNRKSFKNFQFLWEYLDTSTVNGRVYLPIYIREILGKVYYRKDPKVKKEIRHAVNMTSFDEVLDAQSLTSIIDLLYQDVDLYENDVQLLDNNFLSPMAPWALNYYRFYIQDTTFVNNKEAIHLAFIPRNKTFIGFTGDIYISNDGRYSLLKAVLGITKDISMNFVRDIKVVQEFSELDSVYILNRDEITLDIALSKGGIGMYASRINSAENHKFTPPDDLSVYDYPEEVNTLKDAFKRDELYWDKNRLDPLSAKQEGIYTMIDTLKTVPAYKRFIWATKVITTGYIPAGLVDFGKISNFVTGNQVEGARFRLGVESAFRKGRKYQARSYVAYGTRDKRWKYKGSLLWSFNEDFIENPRNFLEVSYRHDVVFPGLKLEFIEDDNLLTSIRRGEATQMLFVDSYNADYTQESEVGFWKVGVEHRERRAYGSLGVAESPTTDNPERLFVDGNGSRITDVTSSELSFAAEFSPNTAFVQGREIRVPIKSIHPRFQLSYRGGFNVLGGDHSYHNISIQMKKRVPLSVLGVADLQVQVGGVFGSNIPFVLLYIPRANQAYSFQPTSFNTMNFMEFVSDKYARLSWQHFPDGYFLNRIPLIKKLKLKEVFGFKIIHGGLNDINDPRVNRDLIQFNQDADGNLLTTTFDGKKPFMEYSVGVYNIFRFLRFDFVKRINYLDRPNVENLFGVRGLGLRGRFKVEF